MDTLIPDAELAAVLKLTSDIVSDVAAIHRGRAGMTKHELLCELVLIRKTAAMLLERAQEAEQTLTAK